MNLYQPTITGSLSVSGSINISGSINVVGGGGTITGTASYATNAELLDGLDSTVFTLTSSFAAFTASQNILNGTYATTGSNTFAGIQTINSNLTVTGSITAQTLVVQTITSSVDFVTGSTRFGSLSTNTHQFTGSLLVTGSSTFNGALSGTSATFSSDLSVINTSNALLKVYSNTTSTPIADIELMRGTNTTWGADAYTDYRIRSSGGDLSIQSGESGTTSTRMTIGSGGKVGISTSVAGDVLLNVVNSSSTGYGMNISAGSGSGNYALRVENYNGASTLLYVRGDGNIGINETSANIYAKLQVTATSGETLALANPSAAAAGGGSSIWFYGTTGYNTQGIISTGYDGTSNVYAYMSFFTRGGSTTERMRITSVGNLEMRPIVFSGVANNATQTVLSNMGKGTWLVSVANDVDSSDGYSAMLWVRTNEIIQMQVFRVDSMVFSYSNQDLRIQNTSGFAATLYVTAIRMAAS